MSEQDGAASLVRSEALLADLKSALGKLFDRARIVPTTGGQMVGCELWTTRYTGFEYGEVRQALEAFEDHLTANEGAERRTVRVHPIVGFPLLRKVCGKQSRNPTVCYHPDNPGHLGDFGGGRCVKAQCPVWRELEEANIKLSNTKPARAEGVEG